MGAVNKHRRVIRETVMEMQGFITLFFLLLPVFENAYNEKFEKMNPKQTSHGPCLWILSFFDERQESEEVWT